MSVNLIELLQGQMGSSVMDAAGKLLGASSANTQKGVGSALTGILGGLMNGASAPGGADKIFDLVTKGGIDDGLLNNVAGIFTSGNRDMLTNSGNSLLGSLFGGSKLGTLANIIGKVSGLGGGASSSLLSMIAPIAIGMLKRHVMSKGMNAVGLGNLLGGQKEHLTKAASPDMLSFLGLSAGGGSSSRDRVTSTAKQTTTRATGAATEAAASGGGLLKKLLPLLLLGILGFLGWTMFGKGCAGDAMDATKNAANKAVETTKNVADKTADAAKATANKAVDATKATAAAAADVVKKGADFFKFEKGSTAANFADFLTNPNANLSRTFILDKVEFDTGKSSLRASSQAQLSNISRILKEYGTVNIELQGHTDNTGNAAANTKLSQARAEAVKAFLGTKGIKVNRMGAKGFGSSKPRAKNDTAENRQKNRRTEIRVTKR